MINLKHLSYSSISTYQACARSWRYRYIDNVKALPTPALVFGTAFHHTVEDFLRQRAQYTPADLAGMWKERWTTASNKEIRWNGELPEQLENDGARLLSDTAVLQAIGNINVLEENDVPVIEKYIELRVPGVPIPIVGYIDMITADGVPCDFKTSARAWTPEKASEETQPLFYLAALNQAGYKTDYRFRHYVFCKTKKPQIQVIGSKHNVAALFWLYQIITSVWRGIEAELYPCNPGSWKCNEKFCDYWLLCRRRR